MSLGVDDIRSLVIGRTVAETLGIIATCLVALGVIFRYARRGWRNGIEFFRKMAARLEAIDRSTNHQEPGGPTMSEQVRSTSEQVETIDTGVKALRSAVMELHGQNVEQLKAVAAESKLHGEQIEGLRATVADLTNTVADLAALVHTNGTVPTVEH